MDHLLRVRIITKSGIIQIQWRKDCNQHICFDIELYFSIDNDNDNAEANGNNNFIDNDNKNDKKDSNKDDNACDLVTCDLVEFRIGNQK